MSLNIEGKKCVVCSAYLFPEDDVVFCPTCGAPHHRDCYNAKGECGLEALHGTAEQYKDVKNAEEEPPKETAEKKNTCRYCGGELDGDARFCPYCSRPAQSMSGFTPQLPFLEVIKPEEELCDRLKAGEVAKTVNVNFGRYISKFRGFKDGHRLSWNWAAFLLPHGWFAFRKMYLLSAVAAAFMVAASLFSVPLLVAESNIALSDAAGYSEAMKQLMALMTSAGPIPIICSLIGAVLNLGVRVVSALFGDYAYKNRVVSVIGDVNEAEDKQMALAKKGGVSFIGFAVAVFCQNLVLQIIAGFLM